MTRDEIRTVFMEELTGIAPDVEIDGVDPAADLRETVDLDSMDIFNLVIALHERLGLDIPDADAPRLVTLAGAVDYLAEKLEA